MTLTLKRVQVLWNVCLLKKRLNIFYYKSEHTFVTSNEYFKWQFRTFINVINIITVFHSQNTVELDNTYVHIVVFYIIFQTTTNFFSNIFNLFSILLCYTSVLINILHGWNKFFSVTILTMVVAAFYGCFVPSYFYKISLLQIAYYMFWLNKCFVWFIDSTKKI